MSRGGVVGGRGGDRCADFRAVFGTVPYQLRCTRVVLPTAKAPRREGDHTLHRTFDQHSRAVIGLAMRVHSRLGPGLLENAYEICLAYELEKHGIPFDRQVTLPVRYDGIHMEAGYRIDLLIDNQLVVEIKTVKQLLPVHDAQLLTYLRLGDYRAGLLLNFHVAALRDGLKRIVNNF